MADFHAGELGTNLIPRVPDYPGPTSTLDEGWHRQLFGRGEFHITTETLKSLHCYDSEVSPIRKDVSNVPKFGTFGTFEMSFQSV